MRARPYNLEGWLDLAAIVKAERYHSRSSQVLRALKQAPSHLLRYTLLFALLIVFLKAIFVEAFVIPSTSMTPTLKEQDYILVPKFLYGLHLPLVDEMLVRWSGPKRGDVVVFTPRANPRSRQDSNPVVKRVIAREGDIVEIVGTQVFLNQQALVEPYARWGAGPAEHVGPYLVPEGRIFVLGDNRANSEDSRVWADPFVPISDVLGKAVMVYWSGAHDSRMGTVL